MVTKAIAMTMIVVMLLLFWAPIRMALMAELL